MIATIKRDDDRIVRHLNLEDGPILTSKHSVVGRRFRAETVSITYIHRIDYIYRGGGWSVLHVSVSGVALKKDGSDSLSDATNRYYGDGDYPDWLIKIIDAFRPFGGAVKRTEALDLEA